MRVLVLPLFTVLLIACGSAEEATESAAEGPTPEVSEAATYGNVSPQELQGLLEAGEAHAFDANGESTRSSRGVVPGATLLTSSSRYELSELPADHGAHLVFYCGNTDCRASDGAAERALEAGYERVDVMRDGIAGWVEAGLPTDQPES